MNLKAMTICGTIVVGLSTSGMTAAQTERTGNADARVMQQLQQVTAERTSLQAENSQLKQELDKLQKQLAAASSGRTSSEQRLRALEAAASRDAATGKQAEEQLERNRSQLQELVTKFRETAQTLRDVETDRDSLRGKLASQERDAKVCIDRNVSLYKLNDEVLSRLEGRGFWSAVAGKEPFTRLKRVELENLIEDYRYRADELALERAASAAQTQP